MNINKELHKKQFYADKEFFGGEEDSNGSGISEKKEDSNGSGSFLSENKEIIGLGLTAAATYLATRQPNQSKQIVKASCGNKPWLLASAKKKKAYAQCGKKALEDYAKANAPAPSTSGGGNNSTVNESFMSKYGVAVGVGGFVLITTVVLIAFKDKIFK